MAYRKPIPYGGPTNEPSPGIIERALTFLIDCQLEHEGRVRVGPVRFELRTTEELGELRRQKAAAQGGVKGLQ